MIFTIRSLYRIFEKNSKVAYALITTCVPTRKDQPFFVNCRDLKASVLHAARYMFNNLNSNSFEQKNIYVVNLDVCGMIYALKADVNPDLVK